MELRLSQGVVVEQIIRPTGLIDPEVDVRPVRGQVDDLLAEIRLRESRSERVLVRIEYRVLRQDGAEVRTIALPRLQELAAVQRIILLAETWAVHAK